MQKKYDVMIVGLGTAGAICAIKCAKLGLKTLGIERINQMGGTGTAGGVVGYYCGSDGGMFEEINLKTEKFIEEYHFKSHAEAKSIVLEREAADAGVDFLYNAYVIKLHKNENTVTGATVMCHGETFEVDAKIMIDTTGNAEIARFAGCSFKEGRYQPYTNTVFITNPDPAIQNRDSGYIDMTDNGGYSRELVRANTEPAYLCEPADPKKKAFVKSSPIPGVRECLLTETIQTVSLKDAIDRKTFDNTVFYAYSNVDTHEKCMAFGTDTQKKWHTVAGLWSVNMSISIPMGCFIPKTTDGLLVGGRALGVEHDIAPAVRMKKEMEKSGELLAYMAYLAVTNNTRIRDISYSELKDMLISSNVLKKENDIGFTNRIPGGSEKFEFPKTVDQLRENLGSKHAGYGVYAAQNIEGAADYLASWQNSGTYFGINSALALGLCKDKRAVPALRQIAENRNMELPQTGVKMTVPFGVSAVCLLGLLKDKGSLDLLKRIIEDKGDFDRSCFVKNEMFETESDVSSQFITFAVYALCEIAKEYPSLKEEISGFLNSTVLTDDYQIFMHTKASKGIAACYDFKEITREYVRSNLR